MLLADVRHALRLLGRSPALSLAATLSLAAGIAAPSAIYSVADGLLAPVAGLRDPGRIVDIGRANRGSGFDNMSYPAYAYLAGHATSLEGMAAVEFGGKPIGLTIGGSSERVFANLVSAPFFDVLGVRPALGRFFAPDEDATPGAVPVTVLTHRFWTERLGADPAVVGTALRLNGREFVVIGVAEPGFEGPTLAGTDLWVPMAMVAEIRGLSTPARLTEPRAVWLMAVGRLKPGVSPETASAELNTLMTQYLAATPAANQRHTVRLLPTSRVPGPMRQPFLVFVAVLFVLTGALLAIAASNVAGLLLARAGIRQREIATRLALGASRGRVMRQLLTETAVLYLLAALVAVPITIAAVSLLRRSLPALPIVLNLPLEVHGRVVRFAAAAALVTAVAFGLAPARHAIRPDVAPLLHGAAATPDRRRVRLRHALVVAQVALSLMLVVTAGTFTRSLREAAIADPGFRTSDVVLANVDIGVAGYRGAPAVDLAQRYEARLSALPGVTVVATSRMVPLQGSSFGLGALHVPGYRGPDGDDRLDADWNVVTPTYFAAVDMPFVEGRAFTADDRDGAPHVAVVNAAFARAAWPGRPAVGQTIRHDDDGRDVALTVVGVVADAKYRYFTDAPAPFIFVPLAQHPQGDLTFFVRHAPGRSPAGSLRAAMAQVEPVVPTMFVQSFEEAVAIGLTPQRLMAWVSGSVGVLGLGLAALGLYGAMAFLVTSRRREMAIRLALGAESGRVLSLVLGQAARLAVVGVLAGGTLALAISQALAPLRVGVGLVDLPSQAAAVAVFAVVLLAAAWRPARQAAGADPAATLRSE
ncbi:MAG: ADOP family duplicated permease [Vicinamibacterales bacterium]